jgi:F-type H+-transporting ATPase subunit gamma
MNNKILLSRMKSIRQTVQISNAQKLIAASHIGRARRMLSDTEPYHERVRQAIAEVLAVSPEVSSRYLIQGSNPSVKRQATLVISANRGLAGGYNSNLMKFTEQKIKENNTQYLFVLGKMGQHHLRQAGYEIGDSMDMIDPPTLYAARELAEHVIQLFEDGVIDCFDVIYTHFTSTVRLAPTCVRLFPLDPVVFGVPDKLRGDVSFEPSPSMVLNSLIPKYLKGFIYGSLVHAWASELASRVTAMDNAIRNGNKMLDALLLAYNRARQGLITQEITEIVAGAASIAEAE